MKIHHVMFCANKTSIRGMAFARDDGCNAIFIVGDCEPQKNRAFLERITIINNMLPRPFRIVEAHNHWAQPNKRIPLLPKISYWGYDN